MIRGDNGRSIGISQGHFQSWLHLFSEAGICAASHVYVYYEAKVLGILLLDQSVAGTDTLVFLVWFSSGPMPKQL